ncbi:hypothetical protein D3C81_1690290 [compost metagenome]
MVACVGIPDFRQCCHGHNGGFLYAGDFLDPPGDLLLQEFILVLQKILGLLQLQVGFHPGEENGRADGLDNIVHCTAGKPFVLVLRIAFGRQENHRDVC